MVDKTALEHAEEDKKMEEELRKAKKDFEYLLNPDANPVTAKVKQSAANMMKARLKQQQEKNLTANSSADLVDVNTESSQRISTRVSGVVNMCNRSRQDSDMGMTLGNMHDSQEELKLGTEINTISSQ